MEMSKWKEARSTWSIGAPFQSEVKLHNVMQRWNVPETDLQEDSSPPDLLRGNNARRSFCDATILR